MNYRTLVKKVYPNAYVDLLCKDKFCAMEDKDWKKLISGTARTHRQAWRKAWELIEKRMVENLEL